MTHSGEMGGDYPWLIGTALATVSVPCGVCHRPINAGDTFWLLPPGPPDEERLAHEECALSLSAPTGNLPA